MLLVCLNNVFYYFHLYQYSKKKSGNYIFKYRLNMAPLYLLVNNGISTDYDRISSQKLVEYLVPTLRIMSIPSNIPELFDLP